MNIKPIGERVLIKPIEQDERTPAGIYIPETAKEKKKQGTVIEIGTFDKDKNITISKGDTILYTGYSSEEIEIGDEKYIIVDYKDIIAKIE